MLNPNQEPRKTYLMTKNGAFLILFKDDFRKEIFLVYRSDYPIWGLTGGGVERDETPLNAALREAKEETGFKLKVVRPLGVYRVFTGQKKLIRSVYFWEGRRINGDFKPEFPGCKGQWFNTHRLPKDLTHRTREKINDAINFDGTEFRNNILEEPFLANVPLILRHPLGALKYTFNKYLRRKE